MVVKAALGAPPRRSDGQGVALDGRRERPLELAEREGLHEVGDRPEAARVGRLRVDARADDRQVLVPEPENLRRAQRARVGGLEEDHVDVVGKRPAGLVGQVDGLVPEPRDDVPEQGADFRVRVADQDPRHALTIVREDADPAGIWYGSGMKRGRVLVVDDDADIRGLVRELLERQGYDVAEAANGKEGLRAFYAAPPDVVLLDVSVPELDGWETLERIRDLSDVPVAMLTARAAELEKVRGLKAGADDYVTKPFGRQELLARI